MTQRKHYLRGKLWPPEIFGYRHFGDHKAIDFSVHWWSIERGINLFDFSLRIDWRTHHGGIHFAFILLNCVMESEYYDGRHWNYEADRYMTDEEIAAETAEYEQSLEKPEK